MQRGARASALLHTQRADSMMTSHRTLLHCPPDTVHLRRAARRCRAARVLVPILLLLCAGAAAAQQPCGALHADSIGSDTTALRGATAALLCPPPLPAVLRHAQGGWHLAAVLGDSADHLRHNTVNVAILSTGLLVFLWALPEDLSRFYTRNPSFATFGDAYTRPPLWNDHDWWAWNFIGHPFVGMHQYLLERNWGASQLRSFAFSAAASLAWEYGFEAWMERPSVQDMLLTAPVGWVLGEAAYRLTRELHRNGFTTAERLIVVVINPLYVLQHGFR